MSKLTLQAGDRDVEISHPDKVYFPATDGASPVTKGDLCEYYARIADRQFPQLEDRPLSMHRFPDGIDEDGFFQQKAPDWFPDWMERVSVEREKGGQVAHVVGNHPAVVLVMANAGCITPHMWQSRVKNLDCPDRLVFDLDPPGDDFEIVRVGALALCELLTELDVESRVMTTGSRGLHVIVSLNAEEDYDSVRESARKIAEAAVERAPDDLTVEFRKKKRGVRLLVDYYRNARGQHTVVPWAVRAKPGAPVATPLHWDEVRDSDLHARKYTVSNVFRRLGALDVEPWSEEEPPSYNASELANRLD